MKIDKKMIVEAVREAMVKEELAIPLYVSHIEQTFFWSGLPKEAQAQIINKLRILEHDSAQHAIALKKVLEMYS